MSTLKADSVTASSGVNTALSLTGKGTGKVALGDAALTVPDTDGSANQYLRTTGEAALEFATLPAAGLTGFRNLIINGDMAISQRGTVAGITGGGYGGPDRFMTYFSALGTWTVSQDASVPTAQGFASSLKVECTTADASPAASDLAIIKTGFEGQFLQQIKKGTANAEAMVLSFWVRSYKTGTHVVEVCDTDNPRAVSHAYTIDAQDTWQKVEWAIPADVTGAFDNDNALSLLVQWGLGAGTNWTSGTLQETWATKVTANRFTGQVNVGDSTNGTFYITGVQLEVGSSATDFEHVPYDYQLRRCERYYQTYGMGFRAFGIDASTIDSQFAFRIPMRSSPSVTLLDTTPTFTELGVAGRTGTSSSITTSAQGPDGTGLVRVDGFSSVGASSVCIGYQSTPMFGFSAEL